MNFFNLLFLIVLMQSFAFAQRVVPPTDSFKIVGKIKNERTFSISDLEKFEVVSIADQILYNHKGEIKDTIQDLKGIPFKKVLELIDFPYEKPKELNEFYFVFIASDGYKVVFSWNEIYNTETGNNLYLLTQIDGKKMREMEQRIVVMATSDLKTGRRHIKGLERVEIRRVE